MFAWGHNPGDLEMNAPTRPERALRVPRRSEGQGQAYDGYPIASHDAPHPKHRPAEGKWNTACHWVFFKHPVACAVFAAVVIGFLALIIYYSTKTD